MANETGAMTTRSPIPLVLARRIMDAVIRVQVVQLRFITAL